MGIELHLAQLTQELAEANAERAQLKAALAQRDGRIAELERQLARFNGERLLYMARIADLEKRLAEREHDWRGTIELMANPNIEPGPKVVAFNLLIHQGGAPGRLPQHVLTDDVPVCIADIAHQSGYKSTTQTSAHMQSLSLSGIIPMRQERVRNENGAKPKRKRGKKATAQPGAPTPEPTPEPEKDEKDPPPFIYKTYLTPIEGPDAPILHPAQIGPLVRSPRLDKRKKNAQEERADVKGKLDRLKVLEGRCPNPDCGEIDPNKLALHCHKCGTAKVIAELPDAKRVVRGGRKSQFKRREEPHAIDADGNDVREKHYSPRQAVQQDLFPTPQAGPQVEVSTGAEIRAARATAEESSSSLASSQQSVSSRGEQCIDKGSTDTKTPTIGGTGGEQYSPRNAPAPAPASRREHYSPRNDGADQVALGAAADLLLEVFGVFDEHIFMRRDRDPQGKYGTKHEALTRERLIEHLTGRATLGGRLAISTLSAPSGKMARAWAWDSDEKDGWEGYHRLKTAAYKLAEAGLRPLFIDNEAKKHSAHVWVISDRPVDARQAQLACEVIAPELGPAFTRERYPDPKERTGGRIRFPLGAYRPEQGPPVVVKVGYVRGPQDMVWCQGTEPRAWAVLTSAISDAAILETTHIPIVCRDQPPPPPKERRLRVLSGNGAGRFDFAAWNVANPIETLADWARVGAQQKCIAPWRNESEPSVTLYSDGHWFDYGDDRYHGRDAFDFWAAKEGHYNPEERKVDYKAAFAALGVSPGEGRAEDAASGDQLCFADDDQWDEA